MKLGLGLGFVPARNNHAFEIFEMPAGFSWSPPFVISKQLGRYKTDMDVTSLAPVGQAYYVDPVNGHDGNLGTEIAPFKQIRTAMNANNAVEIYLKAGAMYDLGGFVGDGLDNGSVTLV